MSEATIIGTFGMKPVAPWRTTKAVPLYCPDPSLVYGLELEIEGCPEGPDMVVSGIRWSEDGSLRNHGAEFITQPMTYSMLSAVLNDFFSKNDWINATNYTERCSVHVHTNVQDLTFSQLATIALIYQAFEGLLFHFIGNDRDKNIFCVPWSETQLSHRTVTKLAQKDSGAYAVRDWQKYTALNLLPVAEQGTIEWRHMEGTHDVARILTWCRLIGAVFAYTRANDYQSVITMLTQLNTNSQYQTALRTIFGFDAMHLECPNYTQIMEDGVLNMKYSLASNKPKTQAARSLDDLVRELRAEPQLRGGPMFFNGVNVQPQEAFQPQERMPF